MRRNQGFFLELCGCLYRGQRRGRRRRERDGARGGRVSRRKKRTSLMHLTKIPLTFPFICFKLAQHLTPLALIHTSYSKPKSIMQFFIDYSFPNISRFDLMNNETNSKVDNIIVFGLLLDLVPVNNLY